MPDTPEHEPMPPTHPDAEPQRANDAAQADNAADDSGTEARHPLDTLEMEIVVAYNAVDEPTYHDAQHDTEEMQAADSGEVAQTPLDLDEQAVEDNAIKEAASEPDDLGDWTLTQLLDQFLRAPASTWRAFWSLAQPNDTGAHVAAPRRQIAAQTEAQSETQRRPLRERVMRYVGDLRAVQLGLYIAAVLVAWYGNSLLSQNTARRTEALELSAGAPFLVIGFFIWLAAEIVGHAPALRAWATGQSTSQWANIALRALPLLFMLVGLAFLLDSMDEPLDTVFTKVAPGVQLTLIGVLLWMLLDAGAFVLRLIAGRRPDLLPRWVPVDALAQRKHVAPLADDLSLPWYRRIHPLRIFSALAAGLLLVITWFGTAGNTFTTLTFYAWLGSIALIALTLAPLNFNLLRWLNEQRKRLHNLNLRPYWGVIVLLIGIVLLAASFRITDINNLPPEMTSDHVEKILDSQRMYDGERNIFFANNGGREPMQMYLIAFTGQITGMGVGFDTLKLVAIVQALITIPVLFWLGYEIAGQRNARFGIILGLVLAALVAVSYWHTSVTRLSLRIILTPLVAALLAIFLARGLRRNTLADFILAGLILGFGLYTYQAVRMLPVVVVVAVAIAIYFRAPNWHARFKYMTNLAVLVLVSFVVFVPLFHYSVENPEEFWRRTTGRLLGDDIIQVQNPDGTITERDASLSERLEAFNANVPTLMNNIRNALLMFNWKGDVAWINGAPNHPALSPIAGALLIVGLAAWLALLIRQRDVVHWLIPPLILIMLLPSALSIAFPLENPSHTRTSGALPFVFLVAALSLALMAWRILQLIPRRRGQWVAVTLVTGVVLASYIPNANVYFNDFRRSYLNSSLPYSEAGRILQGFALSDGSFGNAFMIAYPFWWDHRAVGMEAGINNWPNGIVQRNLVPDFLELTRGRTDRYRLDPNRDLLFFYHIEDDATARQLEDWFPDGRHLRVNSYQQNDDFMLYRVPALGNEALELFLRRTTS